MSVNLKNPVTEQLLNELAEETGESLTEAATVAVRERLERLHAQRAAEQRRSLGAVLAIVEEARKSGPGDERPLKQLTDELWGDS